MSSPLAVQPDEPCRTNESRQPDVASSLRHHELAQPAEHVTNGVDESEQLSKPLAAEHIQHPAKTEDDDASNQEGTTKNTPSSESKFTQHIREFVAAFKLASKSEGGTWNTTWKRYGPLSGIAALILALLSLFASFAILYASDGAVTANWKFTPATYLAIFTAIANQAMAYASLQGAVIAWWLSALNGSTLDQLHRDWKSGTTLLKAVTAGRSMSLISMACIVSTIVAVDGPLLQRSTKVRYVADDAEVQLDVTLLPEIPHNGTGQWAPFTYIGSETHPPHWTIIPGKTLDEKILGAHNDFRKVQWGFSNGAPLSGIVKNCPGSCNATVKAPALARVSCESTVVPVDYSRPYTNFNFTTPVPLDRYGFLSESYLEVHGEQEIVRLLSGYSTTKKRKGQFNVTVCDLRSAIGEYDVSIVDNIVKLASPPNPRTIALANNSMPEHGISSETPLWHASTLSGIISILSSLYHTNTFYENVQGIVATSSNNGLIYQWQNPDVHGACSSFYDPLEYVVQKYQEMMFRSGAYFGQEFEPTSLWKAALDANQNAHQVVTGNILGHHDAFHTNYAFFATALAIEIACIAIILTTYWGWWRLGCPVSFSPVEIAKGFEAPLLASCNSNISADGLAKAAGDLQVQYGATRPAELRDNIGAFESRKVAFAKSHAVYEPAHGDRFES